MSVVKMNALVVPPEMREAFEQRFAARAGTVEQAEGFERFELLRPTGGLDRYLVITHWRSVEDFERWSHGSTGPSGPVATSNEVWSFEVLQSTSAEG